MKSNKVWFSYLLQETERRYNAVLQMYGEKAEEVQELKLDLQDVKEMYRQQVRKPLCKICKIYLIVSWEKCFPLLLCF